MSTLTKILIILLSAISFCLCASVLTYVGTADNYKVLFEDQKKENDILEQTNATLSQLYNQKMVQMKDLEAKLRERIEEFQAQKSDLEIAMGNAERKNRDYQARMLSSAGLLTGFQQDIAQLLQSLESTRTQLDKTRTQNIEDRKDLNEIQASLYVRIAQMEDLDKRVRRLLEERAGLERKIQSMDSGTAFELIEIVTPEPGPAQPAVRITGKVNLKGLITDVEESLVTISIGSDDGVTKNMRFHVFRGVDFICDVIITYVDTNKAAGVIEMGKPPRIGDTVITEL